MRARLFLFVLILCAWPVAAQAPPREPAAAKHPEPVAPATASPAVESPKIDPAKEASIRQLLEVAGVRSLFGQLAEQTSESQKSLLMTAMPPGDYRPKLAELFLEKCRSKLTPELLLEGAIPVYDKYFTIEEIKGLAEFYQTPLGKKAVSVLPKASSELYQKGLEAGRRIARESMMEVLQEHPDLKAAFEAASAASKPAPGGVPGGVAGTPSAPKTEGATRIRVSGAVQEAKLINKVFPTYPQLARQAHIQGTVKLHAIIGTDGTVEELDVVSGPPLLVQAAIDAVKQWRYEPTLLSGRPMMVETYIDLIFTLSDKPPQPQ